MTRIGILSDTHGDTKCIDWIVRATKDDQIDMWLHGGDYCYDADYMRKLVHVPVYAVRGNNDYRANNIPWQQVIPIEGGTIYMTHGHTISYKNPRMDLLQRAQMHDASLVVVGHSHCVEICYLSPSCMLINPGSPSLPRDGAKSFVVVDYNDGLIKAEVRYLKDI